MRDQQVSSLVVRGRSPGLVTASDLRDRVLAAGRGGETLVEAVMTAPLQTMPAEATLGEVLLAMVDRGIHHLPLVREGQLVGMVTDTDLLCCSTSHATRSLSDAGLTARPARRACRPTPERWPRRRSA
jgi:CBS domain-containing protein